MFRRWQFDRFRAPSSYIYHMSQKMGLTVGIVGSGAGVYALFRARAVGRRQILPLSETQPQLLRHLRVVLVMQVVENAAPCHLNLQRSTQPLNTSLLKETLHTV